MGVPDAPGWLVPAFVRSVLALGATETRERIEATGEALLARWCSPDRHHHGLRHLVLVLERVDSLAQEVHNPEMVRVAAWYHGAVFDVSAEQAYRGAAGKNHRASAELAEEQLTALGISPKVAVRIHDLILSLTKHDPDHFDVDAMALCDADLGTLAVEPQKYREYRKRVRAEYALVPDRDYLEARIAVITKLLARREIFLSPHAASWEPTARQNLEAELVILRAELAGLAPVPAPGVAADHPVGDAVRFDEADGAGVDGAGVDGARVDGAGADADAAGSSEVPADRPGRQHAERFTPDRSYSADDTLVLGMEPERKKSRGSADEAEVPECIGVPFEEQAAVARAEDSRLLSNMEREPVDPASLPRRLSVEEARRKAEKHHGAPSTGSRHDDESTGTLFRPLEG